MSGLESTGFVRKTLQEILESMKQNALNEFGPDFNVGDDSVFMQIAGPFSIELDNIWQAAEAAYDSYTVNGAEGIHLDNYLAFFGVTRLDATPSVGSVLVASDVTTLVDPTSITGTQLTDALGNIYDQTDTSVTIGKDNTFAYRVLATDLALATSYDLTVTDDLGAQQTTTLNVTDEASKQSVLAAIQTHIETHRADTVGKIFRDTTGVYIGFSSATVFDVLTTTVVMYFTNPVGTRYSKVDVTSTENKFHTLNQDSTFSINPTYTGYVSAKGVSGFTTGTNVETDAEYRIRANNVVNTQVQASLVAITDEVFDSGVSDVVIYENTTATPTTEVPQAYAIHAIVSGGTDALIAQAIYNTLPVNVSTYGSENVAVPSGLGGVPVTINFSRSTAVTLGVDLEYTPTSGFDLTTSEKEDVRQALVDYVAELGIGDNFRVFRAATEVTAVLATDKLSALTVKVKEISGGYQTTDYVAAFDEDLSLISSNIVLTQV